MWRERSLARDTLTRGREPETVSSLGQSEVTIGATRCGTVRVETVHGVPALRPRLVIRLRVDLKPVSSTFEGQPAIKEYSLSGISGDLKLKEGLRSVGLVHPLREPWRIAAQSYPHEDQLDMVCDLDHLVIERIEEARSGEELDLQLELWPEFVRPEGSSVGYSAIRPIDVRVPRPLWHSFLESAEYGRYELVEIRIPVEHGEAVSRAVAALKRAESRLRAGEWNAAVGEVRKVVEALEDRSTEQLKAAIRSRFGDHRGQPYNSVVSKLKQLASIEHHEFGTGVELSRAEARFAVRAAAGLVEIVSEVRTTADRSGT